MANVAVVYWSMTGNTEAMAQAVAAGAEEAGAQVNLVTAAEFSAADVAQYDALAFGCPSMGDEVLEEDEFQPLWDDCVPALGDKPIALFGSWGWGGGVWMDNWKEECASAGLNLKDTVICESEPDDDAVEACKQLGAQLAQ